MPTLGSDILEGLAQASIPDLEAILVNHDTHLEHTLQMRAKTVTEQYFGQKVYLRGLIEISNYCRNNCYYCGIRSANRCITRYRLSAEEVEDACKRGYEIGFRTFVLQGGEDLYWRGEHLISTVRRIHSNYPDCAITLSLGEMEYEEYKALFDAGATRYYYVMRLTTKYTTSSCTQIQWIERTVCKPSWTSRILATK